MFLNFKKDKCESVINLDKMTHLYVKGDKNTGKTMFIEDVLQKVGNHKRIDVTIPLKERSNDDEFFTPSLLSRLERESDDCTPTIVVMSHKNLSSHNWLFEGSREIERLITEGEKVNYFLIIETRKDIDLDEGLKEKMKVIQM